MGPHSERTSQSLDAFGLTNIGNVRKCNQDQFLIASLNKQIAVSQSSAPKDTMPSLTESCGQLLVVADGMGGRAAGERASLLAVQNLSEYVLHMMHWHLCEAEMREDPVPCELIHALGFCQDKIHSYAEQHPECQGMGTTLTAAYLAGPHLFVLHAGDSRCYLLRDGQFMQVTVDHTVAQQMVDAGAMSRETATRSPMSHCVWNAVGGNSNAVQPQLAYVRLIPGDALLLCSDGLTNHVTDERLRAILMSGVSSRNGCEQLIRDALDLGGSDNITAIVARVVASPELDGERTLVMSAGGDSQPTLAAACSRVTVPSTNSLPSLATV